MSRYNPNKKRCGLVKVPHYSTYRIGRYIMERRIGDTYISRKAYDAGQRKVLLDLDEERRLHRNFQTKQFFDFLDNRP